MITVPDAIVAAVQAAVPSDALFEGMAESTPPRRYVVVSPDNGLFDRQSYRALPDDATFRWSLMCVAPDRAECSYLARTVVDYLLHNRIAADDRSCSMVTHVNTREPVRDEAITDRPVLYSIDEFSLFATRS